MAVERFEDRAQEAVGEEHARSSHIDDGDAFFGCDGFEDILALRGASGDARTFAGRVTGVEDVDRNIFLDGGQHRRGVQDFRAEVREFGSFVEADDFDAPRFGTDSRIGGEDAIDVGPDLDTVGAQAGADDGGGEIGAAAADGGGDSGAIRADEAAHDRDLRAI